jgi:Domain of unknown function (DUF397)
MLSASTPGMAQEGALPEDVGQAAWHKSTFSNLNGNCVEVGRFAAGRVGVRDTKDNGAGPVLVFSGGAWRDFVAGVRAGEF